MVCITLLCVQPIPILSAFFLCHPYIPLSNLKNFSFTCYIILVGKCTDIIIIHLDKNRKTSVTFSWRAEGTNDIAFLYVIINIHHNEIFLWWWLNIAHAVYDIFFYRFAVVVQNSENVSTFYSTAESAVLH